MREDYVPNEKYRNMFGIERNGYGMERVDLYLAQLEVAFKKIREDNRSLKRELTERPQLPPMGAQPGGMESGGMPYAAQEQYIAQLQLQLAEQQEQNQRLMAQFGEAGLLAPVQPQQTEDLMEQISALRTEADELRQQLRRQPAAPAYSPAEDNRQDLIGKVLVEARAQAEETRRAAKQEADQMIRKARQQVDDLRAEREKIHAQLQTTCYALRDLLREAGGELDYKQRGDDFASA
jgi:cell division septum initiation protein DivIVA